MNSIDTYLASVSPSQKTELERIRRFVQQLVPEAEETISYGMPTFKYKGKVLIHYAAFKDHMSIFPTAGPLADPKLSNQLEKFRTSKGTLQFTEDNIIPESLIKGLVTTRIKSIEK